MLRLGTQNIQGLYLGEQKIKKAYLGENPVFSAAKPSRLPPGYTEVEYISNPHSAYIADFGVTNSYLKQLRVELKVDTTGANFDSASNFFALSVYTNSYKYYIYNGLQLTSDNKFRYYNSDTQYAAANYIDVQVPIPDGINILVFDAAAKKISVNEVSQSIQIKYSNTNVSVAIPLFTSLAQVQTSSGGYRSTYGTSNIYSGRIYEIKVYYSGTLSRHFIPCIGPSNTVGFYDIVYNYFISSSASGKMFTAGPTI